MRKIALIALISASSLLVAGCGRGGIYNHSRPDEYAVQRQAPLIMPPDFALNPPAPGAPRPSSRATNQDTLDALFGGPAPRSEIEKRTISRAGTPEAGIRSTVGDPKTNTVAKGELTRDVLAAPQGDGREAQAAAGG